MGEGRHRAGAAATKPSRRRHLLIAATVTLAAVLAASGLVTAGQPDPAGRAASAADVGARPNVLLILTDDQRAGTQAGMPNVLEHLTGRGTSYPNAFVPTSWCCPSRASLLSGKYSHSNGVWENGTGSAWGAWAAFARGGEETDTLATRLDGAGYRTGLFGKYLNDTDRAGRDYVPPGWNDWHAFLGGGYTRYRLSTDTEPVRGERRYLTDELTDRTVDFIASTPADQPFFAYFSPFAPHYPFDGGPYTGATREAGLLDDVMEATGYPSPATNQENMSGYPRWMRALPSGDRWRQDGKQNPIGDVTVDDVIEMQADTLMGVDAGIGRLLQTLADTGRLANTLIVFVSDNGYAWGEHRLQGKNTPHDVSVRVPLVMRLDGALAAGTVDDRVVAANIDVHATILDLAGIPAGAGSIDGVSVRGPERDSVVMEAMRWGGRHNRPAYCGLRTRDTLYVRYATGEEELYDYPSDPHELVNLAQDPQGRSTRNLMRERARQACSPTPPGYTWGTKTPNLTAPTQVTVDWAAHRKLTVTWRASGQVGARLPNWHVHVDFDRRDTKQPARPVPPDCLLPSERLARGLSCTVRLPKRVDTVTVTVTAVSGRARADSTPVTTIRPGRD